MIFQHHLQLFTPPDSKIISLVLLFRIQQTNTYPNDKGEAIAVNVLFEHMHDHRPRSCSSDPQKATIDKFKFHFLVNEERNMKYREEMERKKLAAKGNSTDADGTDQEEEEDGNENDTPTVSM